MTYPNENIDPVPKKLGVDWGVCMSDIEAEMLTVFYSIRIYMTNDNTLNGYNGPLYMIIGNGDFETHEI